MLYEVLWWLHFSTVSTVVWFFALTFSVLLSCGLLLYSNFPLGHHQVHFIITESYIIAIVFILPVSIGLYGLCGGRVDRIREQTHTVQGKWYGWILQIERRHSARHRPKAEALINWTTTTSSLLMAGPFLIKLYSYMVIIPFSPIGRSNEFIIYAHTYSLTDLKDCVWSV